MHVAQHTLGGALENLLTSKELASRLRLSLRTLERMRCTGTGPKFIRASGSCRHGRVLYAERDVVQWLEGRRRASTAQNNEHGRDLQRG